MMLAAIVLIAMLGEAMGQGMGQGQQPDPRSAKYVWIEGVEYRSLALTSKERAYRELESGWMDSALRDACKEKFGTTSAVFYEASDIAVTQKGKSFRVTARLGGYCKITRSSSQHAELRWCAMEERGQASCALEYPL